MAFIENSYKDIEVADDLATRMNRHTHGVEHALDIRGIEHDEIYPLPDYARYVLTSGSYAEQGRLAEGIKSRFVMRNRTLELS